MIGATVTGNLDENTKKLVVDRLKELKKEVLGMESKIKTVL